MKILKNLVLTVVLFGGGLLIGSMIIAGADSFGSGNAPGSANDPLITKSYLDEKLNALVKSEIEKLTGVSGGGEELKVVQLKQGQTLIAGSGTEIIVRNGRTVLVSNSSNGIPDVTAGKDILNGEEVPNNHLLVSPADGRGIRPHESVKGTVYVMVRGPYLILQSEQ